MSFKGLGDWYLFGGAMRFILKSSLLKRDLELAHVLVDSST
jgi:hypothetical protein